MSYHDKNIPGSSQSKTNAQGQVAPPGYHYMPDGSLMLDSEMTAAASTNQRAAGEFTYDENSGIFITITPPSSTSAQGKTAPPGYHYMPDGSLMADSEMNSMRSSYPESSTLPAGSTTPPLTFHYWSGCNLVPGDPWYTTTQNRVLYDQQYPSTAWDSSWWGYPYNPWLPSWSAPLAAAASTAFYNLYGAPSVGETIKTESINPNVSYVQSKCWEYLGTQTQMNFWNPPYTPGTQLVHVSTWYAANVQTSLEGIYSDCVGCLAGVGSLYGCTDPTAQNYNPTATVDDGSCIATVYGCTDPVAINYYGGAQVDDGSCCYTSFVMSPGSNTLICVGAGCTDPLATNYDPLATPDDGSCTYPPPVNPCNDPWTNTPGLVQTCCDWCEENALIAGGLYGPPPQGCYDWMCDCCKPPIIKDFDLDLSDIPAAGERRAFNITGDGDGEVEFKLEVKDKDTGKYYNFVTNLFQTTEDSLEGTVTGGKYSGSITFPAVTGSDDQYDIYLYAKPGTKHANYSEARFGDNTLDINRSTGSNSLLMQKVIYQYDALTLTFSGFSPNSTVSVHTPGTDTISVGRGQSKAKTAFSFSWTAATTAAYRVLRQPAQSDVLAFVEPVVDATPVNLPGEDIYPAVSNTDTVNGDVTSGTTVRMDTAVASKMKVGDRVTGNAALNATTATVVSLDSTYIFTLSEAVAIADGITLSFSNQMNYSWTVDNFANVIQEGMIIVPSTNVTSGTSIGTYQDTITIFEDTVDEEIIIQHDQPAVSTLEKKPTVVKGLVTVQEGQITFDKQQVLALGGDTLKIGGYGESEILRVFDWEVKFTDLAITLTAPTTTTSGAVSDSATIGVASKEGIINNVSRIGGVGINSKLQNPLITAGGGATGSGNLTADAAQTLESGITLTVENTSRVATITGNIEIIRAGTSDRTLRFDIEKLLSNSAP
jgi:hypothetical protein